MLKECLERNEIGKLVITGGTATTVRGTIIVCCWVWAPAAAAEGVSTPVIGFGSIRLVYKYLSIFRNEANC